MSEWVAGSTELTINRFDKKQAVGSKGMTQKMSQKAVHGISMEATKRYFTVCTCTYS